MMVMVVLVMVVLVMVVLEMAVLEMKKEQEKEEGARARERNTSMRFGIFFHRIKIGTNKHLTTPSINTVVFKRYNVNQQQHFTYGSACAMMEYIYIYR